MKSRKWLLPLGVFGAIVVFVLVAILFEPDNLYISEYGPNVEGERLFNVEISTSAVYNGNTEAWRRLDQHSVSHPDQWGALVIREPAASIETDGKTYKPRKGVWIMLTWERIPDNLENASVPQVVAKLSD